MKPTRLHNRVVLALKRAGVFTNPLKAEAEDVAGFLQEDLDRERIRKAEMKLLANDRRD